MMGFLALWLSVGMVVSFPVFADSLKRIDPHGAKDLDLGAKVDLKTRSECTICHVPSAKGLGLKANAKIGCTSCHGSAPHSGVAEHMGRIHRGQVLDCLSCHTPHRAQQKSGDQPLKFFSKPVTPKPPKGFSQSTHPHSMIKRTCTECHQW